VVLLLTGGSASWLYLHQQPDPTHVTTLENDGVGSLRWAMATAPNNSTITFDQDLEGKTLFLTNNLITAQKNLRIVHQGAGKITISNKEHFIQVVSGTSLTLSGVTLVGGKANSSPLVKNDGVLTLSDCVISGNINAFTKVTTIADVFGGGGIYNDGFLTLDRSTISGNSGSLSQGGGISNYVYGTVILNQSTISGNTASVGGGIYNLGMLTLNNSAVSGNIASYNSGGISNGNKLTLNNSQVIGNKAMSGSGGGISNVGTATLTGSTVSGNTVDYGAGAGIDNEGIGTFTLMNSTVSENRVGKVQSGFPCNACGGGAGIFSYTGKLILINSTISDNTTFQGKGGGLSSSSLSVVTIAFCTFYNNTASEGGGIATIVDPSLTVGDPALSHHPVMISNSLIAGNHARMNPDGEGIFASGGYNLIQNASGFTFPDPSHKHPTDRTDLPLVDLHLDAMLRSNGGSTQTLALLPGSPALDAIPLSACHIVVNGVPIATDQRGVKRPQGDACDIGAYEYAPGSR
jgi:hypothetical protein